MSTPSNRRRLENCQGVDHISNLPDVILCHILSFIPTKLSIMTSILSKRWKYLWTKVAALDFTTNALLNPCKSLKLKKKISFQSFVDRVLLHNDASYLRHLCFDVLSGVDEFYVKSWLSAIARREIRMIRITHCQPMVDCIPLPSGFLSSEKLVVLKLFGSLSIDFPTSFHLPNLETTHLTGVQLPGDEFLKRLSLGCPVLRELCVINCHGIISTLHIESSSLETLNIEVTFSISGSPLACIIRAPNLRYLCLKHALTPHDINNLSLLVEVDLEIKWNDAKHVRKLLEKISGVKTARLEISKFFRYESKLPIFLNLTHLKLRADGNMAKFLNCAPNLKSLIIEYAPSEEYLSVTDVWPESLSSLENVELQIFKDANEHMALVAHFLKAASALKEMKIIMRCVDKRHLIDAYPVLLALPRSSPCCQVKVVS